MSGRWSTLYSAAWDMGVKTTYYLHMMPRHTAEQSTVKVNKAEQLRPTAAADANHTVAAGPARRGFGFGRSNPTTAPTPTGVPTAPTLLPLVEIQPETELVDGAVCPVDPQERLQCESCQ